MEMSDTSSKVGIVYLIQPAELVGTNRFKIGCSAKNTIDRCINGYRKGSRCIYIVECINPFDVEKKLKTSFNYNFKVIAGKEYYEGDETTIKMLFKEIVFYETTSNTPEIVLEITKEDLDNQSSGEDETNEEESSDEISTDEQPEVEPIIEITTYADYIKYSSVTDIIITNKKYLHGYIKLGGNIYYQFVDGSDPKEFSTEAYVIDNKSYTRIELRKILPYCIEINSDKTKFYTINRDYDYIGYDNVKSLKDIEPLHELFKREYLFNDGNKPWESTVFFNDYVKKYLKLTKDMIEICKDYENSLNIVENSFMSYVDSKNEHLECLQGWLQNNCKDYGVVIDHKFCNLSYDWNKIIADIKKLCYKKEPNLCIPEYSEYVLNNKKDKCVMLNTHNFKTSIINDRIVLNSIKNITLHVEYIDDIDISIVDNLISSYVTDKTHILNFKKLCKSVFVQSSAEPIIFNDLTNSHFTCLTYILDTILYNLNMCNKKYSIDFSDDNKELVSHIKKNGIPRVLFIYDVKSQTNISKYTNLGIKNIVKYNLVSKGLYSIENYNKWCITNKDIIDKHCKSIPIDYMVSELLYKQKNLFWHFFKWCCVD
jgi:hypothetical protein